MDAREKAKISLLFEAEGDSVCSMPFILSLHLSSDAGGGGLLGLL